MQNFIKAVKKMHKKYLNNGTQKKHKQVIL